MKFPSFIYYEKIENPKKYSVRSLVIIITVSVLFYILFLWLYQLYFSIFPATFGYKLAFIFIVMLFLTVVIFARARIFPFKHLALQNQMSKLIQQKKYQEVIDLGESIPQNQLLLASKINLAAAYYYIGRIEEAKKLINSVKLPAFIFPPSKATLMKKVLEDWKEKLNS